MNIQIFSRPFSKQIGIKPDSISGLYFDHFFVDNAKRSSAKFLSSRLPFFQLDFFPGYPSNGNEFKRPVFSLTFIVDTCAFLPIIQQGHFGCQQIFSKTKKSFKVEGENEEVKKMMLYGHTQLPSFKVWGQQEKVALSKYDLRP